jgi:hypothetical protein
MDIDTCVHLVVGVATVLVLLIGVMVQIAALKK